jgi:replicative DNA helicase
MTGHPRPYNAAAERTVLGYAMIHPEWCNVLTTIVARDDYFEDRHRWYHSALVDLGAEFTFERLSSYLREMGSPEQHRDIAYQSGLISEWSAPTEDNARRCADDVHRFARLRRLIDVMAKEASEVGKKGWRPDDEYLSQAESRVLRAFRDTRQQKHTITMADQVHLCFEAAERAGTPNESTRTVKTGFPDIDKVIGSMKGGDLVIIAGRPAMGKSALAVAIAWGRGEADPVQLFSAEMTQFELTNRMLSAKARVDGHRLANGGLTADNWGQLAGAANELVTGTQMFLTDCSGWRISRLCSEARAMAITHDIGLIVVDYIQLITGEGNPRFVNREREIASISKALKGLAKELDIPVIALSQLNRDLEKRPDRRPIMSDLRESGAIEQDADKIMFLYRDEVYFPHTSSPGIAEVNIAKNRGGRTGRAYLRWTPKFTRFDDFTEVDP